MKRELLWVVLVVPLGSFGGCATIHPKITVRHFGQMDPDRDEQVSQRAESARVAGDSGRDVEVVAGRIPEGLSLEENGSKLVARPGAEQQYEILGEVEADYGPPVGGAVWRNFFWTWRYDEGWRKGLCYPQVPLKLLSLGAWYIVPLSWPCMATAPGDPTERERALLRGIKHGVAAMGGNLAIVVSSGEMSYVTVTGNRYSATGVVNTIKKTALKAFALKRRRSVQQLVPVAQVRAR